MKDLKKLMCMLLTLAMLVTGFVSIEPMTARAGETGGQQSEDDLQQLIMQKNEMKFMLRKMEDSPEKAQLQKEYDELCRQLKEKGVSNHITEDLPLYESSGTVPYQAPVPDVKSYLEKIYDVDTYYNHITVDGKKYTLYNVMVTDNGDKFERLSYRHIGEYVLQGDIINENAANQFWLSSVKFITGLAANAIPNVIASVAVSTFLSSVNSLESFELVHGSRVLAANTISVNEMVQYIYGYDEKNDQWIHLCSRNMASVIYTIVLTYKRDGKIINEFWKDRITTVTPDRGGKSLKELVERMLLIVEDWTRYSAFDGIGDTISVTLTDLSDVKIKLNLHGKFYPGHM